MKRLLLLVPVIAIAAYFMFFTQPKEINKNIDFNKNEIMAINFVGGLEEFYDYSKAEELYPDNNFKTIELGGSEKYLIMPRFDRPVYVYTQSIEMDTTTKVLVEKVTGNFFITCNQSDIFPNASLETTVDGTFYSYSPFLSGKDGSLVTDYFVKQIE